MTTHLEFLAALPVRAVLDGGLVAFGADRKPDFVRVCEQVRILPGAARTAEGTKVRECF
jgi:hypothetical protein